jgi:hypothetical protein
MPDFESGDRGAEPRSGAIRRASPLLGLPFGDELRAEWLMACGPEPIEGLNIFHARWRNRNASGLHPEVEGA